MENSAQCSSVPNRLGLRRDFEMREQFLPTTDAVCSFRGSESHLGQAKPPPGVNDGPRGEAPFCKKKV